jgi:hypothetical protein
VAIDMPISTVPFLFPPEISMMNESAQEKPGMPVSPLPDRGRGFAFSRFFPHE